MKPKRKPKLVKVCEWKYQDMYEAVGDYYDTSCEDGLYYIAGHILNNGYKYCPNCGKLIKVVVNNGKDRC